MHWLSSYDAHLFVKELGCIPGNIKAFAESEEKFISFSKWVHLKNGRKIELRFLYLYRFLPYSLEELVQNLKPEELKNTRQCIPDDDKFEISHRKGIFPYDYFTDRSQFDEEELPPPKAFDNILEGCECSDKDYQLAEQVSKKFECKTFGDFHDHYLKADVFF